MHGEMRRSQPPTPPAGLPTEPVRPPCALNFSILLEPSTAPISQERLATLNKQAAQQTGSTCIRCLENPELGIIEIGSCPAKSDTISSEVILRLRDPLNRAPRRRTQHILTNQKTTAPIPALDQETRAAIKGEDTTKEIFAEDDTPISPQALRDINRGVDPKILRDLGY